MSKPVANDSIDLVRSVISLYFVEKLRSPPIKNESMVTFLPGAIAIQLLPQLASGLAIFATRTSNPIIRLIYVLGAWKTIQLFRVQLDAIQLFKSTVSNMDLMDKTNAIPSIGKLSLSRIAAMTLFPFFHLLQAGVSHFRDNSGVRVASHIKYSRQLTETRKCNLLMDILYSHTRELCSDTTTIGDGKTLPVFIYIHGGGWVTGTRKLHSIATLMTLARAGWIVVSIDYRLADQVKLEDQILDCKAALAWVRINLVRTLVKDIKQFSRDSTTPVVVSKVLNQYMDTSTFPKTNDYPMMITVGGESAGGHLSLVLALTMNEPKWQPMLPNVDAKYIDTSMEAVVDLCGVHDIEDQDMHFYSRDEGNFRKFIRDRVIKLSYRSEKDAYISMSPTSLIKQAIDGKDVWCLKHPPPPIFGIHGESDSLVPIEDARRFYSLMKHFRKLKPSAKRLKDGLVELPNAPHAYNITLNPWTYALGDSISIFLADAFLKYTLHVSKL